MVLAFHPAHAHRRPKGAALPARLRLVGIAIVVVPIVVAAYLFMWALDLVTPRKNRDRPFYPW